MLIAARIPAVRLSYGRHEHTSRRVRRTGGVRRSARCAWLSEQHFRRFAGRVAFESLIRGDRVVSR